VDSNGSAAHHKGSQTKQHAIENDALLRKVLAMRNLKNSIVKKIASLTLAVAGLGFAATNTFADDFTPSAAVAADYQPRTMEELQTLAGPVALYPDALLAQVFVAATYPNDVVAAAQFLQNGGDPNLAANQGWDASVQGLVQAPDALNQLAGNVDWMNQLGDAFLNQQQDVMDAVQSLRQQAQTAGNLCTTPEQQVVQADNCIQIIPANPQVIYVPTYDPRIVYVRRVGFDPCITFCPGVRVGLWLHEDFDWCDHRIYCGDWGYSRPWWNRGGGVRVDYIHSRPGIYVNNVTNINVRSRSISWSHDNNHGRPQHISGPVTRYVNRVNVNTNVTKHVNIVNNVNRNVTNHVNTNVTKHVNSNVTNHVNTNVTNHVNTNVANHVNTNVTKHVNSNVTNHVASNVRPTNIPTRAPHAQPLSNPRLASSTIAKSPAHTAPTVSRSVKTTSSHVSSPAVSHVTKPATVTHAAPSHATTHQVASASSSHTTTNIRHK
jgi:hypothetical protein